MRASPPWFLSESKREWRLYLPLDPDGSGPKVAVVSKRIDDAGWVARVDAHLDRPACISEPHAHVEDAVRWAEERVSWE